MPVYTRIIIPATDFLSYSKELLNKYDIHCYVEYLDKQKKASYKKVDLLTSFSDVFNENYRCFFLCTKELNDRTQIDFYSDKLSPETIEAEGGRENEAEIEQLDLRIVSKLPNDKIRLFINALNKKLKTDTQFGKGFTQKEVFDKNTFYKKGLQKTIWESFERKSFLEPLKLPLE